LAAVAQLATQVTALGDDDHAAAQNLILARCVECHGDDAQESNLRLDTRAAMLRGGDFGPAAVSGKADKSELIRRVATTNPEQMMPPDGERLTADEVAALAAWIDAGLPWPGREEETEAVRDPRLGHWASLACSTPRPPPTCSPGRTAGFQSTPVSGSHSSTVTCPAIFRVLSIFSDTAPAPHSHSSDSP
jgi:mono/diheme cytochrome c family protein